MMKTLADNIATSMKSVQQPNGRVLSLEEEEEYEAYKARKANMAKAREAKGKQDESNTEVG